jgi:hypothetical protein
MMPELYYTDRHPNPAWNDNEHSVGRSGHIEARAMSP